MLLAVKNIVGQCLCFAAGCECDPDVCQNCWVSCGDGLLGEGHRGNMRLFLSQQQRILLAKSDVAGWRAFLKKSVNKNDYLGEYTGELISHREVDKSAKIYDCANSLFLFDLNDQVMMVAAITGLAFLPKSVLRLAKSSSMIIVMGLTNHLFGLGNPMALTETTF